MSVSNYPGFVIPSTTIAVDFWPRSRYEHLTHHFLTHAHSDHTQNLDASWCGSNIYCTKITKRLLVHFSQISPEWIVELEMDKVHVFKLDEEESFNVTLIEANHCPGAVMYLFQGYFGNVLATGDFRYDYDIAVDAGLPKIEIEMCFLDNTYLNEAFAEMPRRKEATDEIIDVIERERTVDPAAIFQFKMKKLGKEELLVKLSQYFNTSVCMSESQYDKCVLHLELDAVHFTREFNEKTLLFTDDFDTRAEHVRSILAERKLICIEPSALRVPFKGRNAAPNHFIVPYSDHSSYDEIIEFVKLVKPKKVVPLVRKPLPMNIDTSDMSVLEKYLSKKPLIDCHDTYKLLLQSKTSVRRSSRLNFHFLRDDQAAKKSALRSKSFVLRKRKQSPESANPSPPAPSSASSGGRRLITVRTKKQRTEIEYESSPEKSAAAAPPPPPPVPEISCPSFYDSPIGQRRSARLVRLSLDDAKPRAPKNGRTRSVGAAPGAGGWQKISEQVEIRPSSSESEESFSAIPEEQLQEPEDPTGGDLVPSNQQANACQVQASQPSTEASQSSQALVLELSRSPDISNKKTTTNDDFDSLHEIYGDEFLKSTACNDDARSERSDAASEKSSIHIEGTLNDVIDVEEAASSCQVKRVSIAVAKTEKDAEEPADVTAHLNATLSELSLNRGQQAVTPKSPASRKTAQSPPPQQSFLDFLSARLDTAVQLCKNEETETFDDHCANIRGFLSDAFKF